MHEGNLIRTKWCPEWGSNPHWEDFKSSASAIGLSRELSSEHEIER